MHCFMPKQFSPAQMTREWRAVCERYPVELRKQVAAAVSPRLSELSGAFYDQMLPDPAASSFLSHELVKTRLHQVLQRWLEEVFELGVSGNFDAAIARQRSVGEVHERIGVPAHLVMRGALRLTRDIYALLAQSEHCATLEAAAYVSQTIWQAVEIMCHSYSVVHERSTRTEESYRLFAMVQDISAEKERQRAALLDWENELMFELSTRLSMVPTDRPAGKLAGQIDFIYDGMALPLLCKSEFGLWFAHKAAHAFEGSPDVPAIRTLMIEVDQAITGSEAGRGLGTAMRVRLSELLTIVRQKVKSIRFLLEQLFQQASQLESGRDALTRLLNRKYLQAIVTREIDFCRRHQTELSILTVDIDFFKRINDSYGHDAGDIVLQQVAQSLMHTLRSGDYVFRLGGEEFLIVLVDTDLDQAKVIADRLCKITAAEPMSLPDGNALNVTLSIGVAAHDGHPDYQRLLKRSDQALYRAKAEGRNRACLAENA